MIKGTILENIHNNKVHYYLSFIAMVLIGYYHLWPMIQQYYILGPSLEHSWILNAVPYIALTFVSFLVIYTSLAGNPITFRSRSELILISLLFPITTLGLLGFIDYAGLEYSAMILILWICLLTIDKLKQRRYQEDDEEY